MHRSPVVLVGRRLQNTLSRSPLTSTLPPPLTPPTTRALHTPKPLPYDPSLGLGDFLPPPALHVVAVEYQKGLLDRLNEEVRGTEMSDMSVMQTIVSSATDRTKVLAFNYASLALNNHFFLDNLKPPTPPYASHQHLISPTLSAEIRAQHGSLAQLKSSFSAAATGLFTSGYVWFVTDAAGNTGVVPTFGPGSVLVRSQIGDPLEEDDPYYGEWVKELEGMQKEAEAQVDGEDGNGEENGEGEGEEDNLLTRYTTPPTTLSHPTAFNLLTSSSPSSPTSPTSSSTPPPLSTSPSASSRPRSTTRSQSLTLTATAGDTLYPLFCVSVHEHAWLSAGYGVWGKERWVRGFWDVVDWGKVSRAYEYFRVR
ncbi:Manganese/iron superoxide dismutase [Lentinula edodes]|nr:Manganese/iron superoxide dismutase [Lentinula edodes]